MDLKLKSVYGQELFRTQLILRNSWSPPFRERNGRGAGALACPVDSTASSPPPQFSEPVRPTWGAQHLRNADGPEAALVERDGDIAAAAALVVVALDVAAGRAAALAVGVIGPGAAAPVAVGVLGAGAVAALAVPLVLVRAGEAGAVPLRGEEELAAQTGAQARTAPLPGAAGRADTHSRVHGSYSTVACRPLPESCCQLSWDGLLLPLGGCKRLAVMRTSQAMSLLGSSWAGIYIYQPEAICLCHNPCLPTISHLLGGREVEIWGLGAGGLMGTPCSP